MSITLQTDLTVPVLSWPEFQEHLCWYQGEHMTCIGPTKSGKTTLIRELMKRAYVKNTHPWQVITVSKRKDEVLDTFKGEGFIRFPKWEVPDPELYPKVMLAPPLMSAARRGEQASAFETGLNRIFKQGGWLVYLDEMKHLADYLRLDKDIELLLHAGRSAGISVVSSVQRPRHVPLMAYDQADHLIIWEARDGNIRKRLGEIGGKADPDVIEHGLRQLPDRHSFLYVNMVTGEVVQTKVEL
jgi:hypothetical protein